MRCCPTGLAGGVGRRFPIAISASCLGSIAVHMCGSGSTALLYHLLTYTSLGPMHLLSRSTYRSNLKHIYGCFCADPSLLINMTYLIDLRRIISLTTQHTVCCCFCQKITAVSEHSGLLSIVSLLPNRCCSILSQTWPESSATDLRPLHEVHVYVFKGTKNAVTQRMST
jgi:hypothetical protein